MAKLIRGRLVRMVSICFGPYSGRTCGMETTEVDGLITCFNAQHIRILPPFIDLALPGLGFAFFRLRMGRIVELGEILIALGVSR